MKKKSSFWSKIPSNVWVLISVGVAILLWITASRLWPMVFATPTKVFAAFMDKASNGSLWGHVWASLSRVLTGFGIAFFVAIPVAFLMAWYEPFCNIVEPWIQFIRNIPPLAYVPLVVLAAGVGAKAQIVVICIATFLTITVTVFQGVINVDETLIKAARVLGANDTVLFVKVIFPATTPFIITAVRLGISVALTTLIAAESTGAVAGLGMRIKALSQVFENAEMMFYIIVVGVIGMLAEKILKFFERRLTSWQEKREI